jgi:hypothetical protein
VEEKARLKNQLTSLTDKYEEVKKNNEKRIENKVKDTDTKELRDLMGEKKKLEDIIKTVFDFYKKIESFIQKIKDGLKCIVEEE